MGGSGLGRGLFGSRGRCQILTSFQGPNLHSTWTCTSNVTDLSRSLLVLRLTPGKETDVPLLKGDLPNGPPPKDATVAIYAPLYRWGGGIGLGPLKTQKKRPLAP